uniref:G-protein coupled receptors family 3 profile domain-containing protein n=1 Tax=Maylandia zebra TaxID=106582 RepID=A0A3P9B6Y6_9CICH
MSWFSWLFIVWSRSSQSLLLVWLVGRELGIRDGLLCDQMLTCSRWGTPSSQGLFQDGDVIIGGLFPLHYQPPNILITYIYAMVFALEEINHSTMLLPGIKLGYHIFDSCGRPPWALQSGLSLVGGDNTSCGQSVPMIIGGASSITSQILSTVLGPLSIPFISYLSTCPCLSDRLQYPNFFRTIPSDIYQARAVAQVVIRFNWTWVGAVVASFTCICQVFQEEIQGAGVCLAFVETLQRENIISDARRAALTIQASTARVILIFTWYTDVRELFLQLVKLNVTDRQFLASEAWSTSGDLVQNSVTSKVANGVLGVATRSSAIPGFESYLRRLHPIHHPDDEFLREFWEVEFGCSLHLSSSSIFTITLQWVGVSEKSTESLYRWVTYNVYLAVYAAAHALHSLLCPIKDSSSENNISTCSSPKQIKLLQHLQEVNFTTPQDETFYFQGADIPAKYDLVNWQKMPDGTLKTALIGQVDGFDLHLNESAIQWITGSNRVPISVCSEICPPGTRKVSRKGKPLCCFDCIPCAAGEISNKTGSLDCERCPLELWSNAKRTACIPRQLDFLAFNETLGITLTTAAVTGVTVTTVVFVVFLHYRHTPVVRANNSELSFLLLVSIKLCFLCSLVFIGRPSVWSCRFQQAAFGISFVLCVSCLKVKTIVVLAAFRSARPGAEALIKWFGPGQQRGSICLLTCIQIIICTIWLSLIPPVPRQDLGFQGSKVTLECAMVSVVGFCLILGYIGLLACTSLILAFFARKLPDNFNEAKLITFSMLIFCAVWVAFVPAYLSSPGKYTVAVEVFAILASSYGLLFCIFAPKCFIILLRPERNTKKYMMAR